MRVFADVPSCLDHLAGLLAGVPSVLMIHDAGTAEFAGIAALDAARLMAAGPAALRELDRGFDVFNNRQVWIARNLAAFLDENDVANHLAPSRLAGLP